MNTQLALSIICKDEVDELNRCLASIAPYVGSIFCAWTGTNIETEKILKKYNVFYEKYTDAKIVIGKDEIQWLNTFFGWDTILKEGDEVFLYDIARNKALDIVPKSFKYVLWMDSDDVFRGGEKLSDVLSILDNNQATAMFMKYIYDVELDDKGNIKNILIEHLRERIILNDGRYKWIAPIHETLIAQNGDIRQLETKECEVVHLSPRSKKEQAIIRNIKALENSIYKTEGKDPRPIYYLAKCFFDLHKEESYIKAEKLIYRYLKSSGWSEERAQAYEYLSEIFRFRKEYNKAIKAAMNALIESPKFPSIFLSLGLTYLLQGKYEEALFWTQIAGKISMPQTTLVVNPRDMIARALEIIFNVSVKTNKLDEAWASILKLRELFPGDKNINNQFKFIDDLKYQRELTKVYVGLARAIEQSGDKNKLISLANAAPPEIEQNPIVSDFIKRVKPPKIWGNNSIAIFCGQGWTVWNPDFYKKQTDQTFVGGSEEAVILASEELVRQGYKVTVYGDPGSEGVYDGVEYLNHFKFNPLDQFNILIGWRNVSLFDIKFNARKTYLWLHDVAIPMDYTQKRLDNITKIMVLSKAQRDLLPQVKEEKFFYTSNGIKEEHKGTQSDNIKTRVIWTSSYDRGLKHLLDIWPDVKKSVPQAELRIFYGWQLFDRFYANNPERMNWKYKIEELMKADGIYHGGRLSQGEIEKEYKKAGVFAYPTDFYEINCLSAIKAQAFGAVPVVMNYGALKETVQHGIKVDGDIWDVEVRTQYKKALISALNSDFDRKNMMNWAKEKYSWSSIISLWIKEYES